MPSASHKPREAYADGPGGRGDRLCPRRTGAVPPADRPRAGRPVRRWRPRPGPGASPAQAKTSVSSPLRNRWQRTPPVARPLAGYSPNGVTLTAPGSVPGSAVVDPDAVTTTEASGSTTPNQATCSPAATRTPCMPPPARPCGRTPSAPKCSSWASVVMKQSVSRPVSSWTAPTTSSPSLSPMTSHSSLPMTSGLTRLTMPSRVPRASPGPSVASVQSASARSPGSSESDLADRVATLEVGVVGRRRQVAADRSSTSSLTSRPREVSSPISPRAVVRDRRDDDVVVGPVAAVAERLGRRRCGPGARWTTGTRSRGRRRPRAGRPWPATGVPAVSRRTVRRGVP